jgi:hypothetical protein
MSTCKSCGERNRILNDKGICKPCIWTDEILTKQAEEEALKQSDTMDGSRIGVEW